MNSTQATTLSDFTHWVLVGEVTAVTEPEDRCAAPLLRRK